jgi:hypothetical protein
MFQNEITQDIETLSFNKISERLFVNNCWKLISILLGGTLALFGIGLSVKPHQTNFEEASALGAATTSIYSRVADYPIHCKDSRDAADCLAGLKSRKASSSALWLGNSQVHAVNQWHEGETNSTPLLFEKLKSHGLDLLTFSQPNASLQEHYVLFEYLQLRLHLQQLILPAVFDDTRESGIRHELSVLLDDVATQEAMATTEIGQRILQARETGSVKDDDTAGIAHTLQERVEQSLNTWLEEVSPLWAARPEIRGRLLISLYLWRNTLLGIKPTTKRKIIRSRYEDNMAAMAAILASAKSHDVKVLVYVAPLRNDVDVPYLDSEYRQYKTDVESLADRYGATFANLENLVPARLWGSKAATSSGGGDELDFMHFQAGGHRLLADRLAELVAAGGAQRGAKP